MMQIDGYFNASNEPSVKLAAGSLTLELLVDTGFDGTLIVPGQIANHLALRYEGLQDLSRSLEQSGEGIRQPRPGNLGRKASRRRGAPRDQVQGVEPYFVEALTTVWFASVLDRA